MTEFREVWRLLPFDLNIARTCHRNPVHKISTLWHFLVKADAVQTDRQTESNDILVHYEAKTQ